MQQIGDNRNGTERYLKPTLNAGCGGQTWGDIRVDIEKSGSILFQGKASTNVVADIRFLPFRNKSFSETRCFHVLEHLDDPKRALVELRRVSEKVVVRVPIWHLYCFLIEALTLPLLMMVRPNSVFVHLREIGRWKKRYQTHKWYIRFKEAEINTWLGIPREYEKILYESVSS